MKLAINSENYVYVIGYANEGRLHSEIA